MDLRNTIYIVEYVWIGGPNKYNKMPWTIRSKTRCLDGKKYTLDNLPDWNYDGSSTSQATTEKSEVILRPKALFKDPFYPLKLNKYSRNNYEEYDTNYNNGHTKYEFYMVLCDIYTLDEESREYIPHKDNTRHLASNIFTNDTVTNFEPWFGLEQEFFLINHNTNLPIGYFGEGKTTPQGQYYCSVGYGNAIYRSIVDDIFHKALFAGIKVSGINAEVAPGQWEIQVGPCVGLEAGDHLWMLRYIMMKVSENYSCYISFHPKPLTEGEWNGSGCHINYSTNKMRGENGLDEINRIIHKMSSDENHKKHLKVYGEWNDLRLTGEHETSSLEDFSHGVGNRGASVRIPTQTLKDEFGYFEDRIPSSVVDPYLATAILFETTIG
jgi:glutamine synthetase